MKKIQRFLRGTALLAVLSLLVSATAFAASVPDPTSDFYVNDYVGVLSGDTKSDIVSKNDGLYNATGAQIVVTVVQDTKLKTSFITLTGALSNGFPIEMRTSVEGIKESVGITNQFLLISGAVTLLVSLLLVFFFSRRFTRPRASAWDTSRDRARGSPAVDTISSRL